MSDAIKFPIDTVEAASSAVCDCVAGYTDGMTDEAKMQFVKLVLLFAQEMMVPGSVSQANG
jgi:hypothetical protein